ncbi:MAG: YhbY family RNA-binding protein [Planctomycetota bacterium]
MDLTKKQLVFLRAAAHPLEPRLSLGKQGVSDGFRAQLEGALEREELIKIRLGRHVDADLAALAAEVRAELVQHVGRMVVLYRPFPAPKLVLPAG